MPVLGVLLEKKIGALALSIGVTGGVLGFGLAMMWRALFIPAPPVAWPDDYAALAERFGQSAAAMTALAAGYAPALLLILKLLKFDTLETLAGALFSDKKGK